MTNYSLDFPRAFSNERPGGVIKRHPEDFVVEELMPASFSGEGEHDYLWIEKTGQNTDYVARQLARYAGVREMDVGFSGLKDRHAVTRQWFSVYRRGASSIHWGELSLEGVTLLEQTRHQSKLRRGQHDGNRFQIKVRDIGYWDESQENILKNLGDIGFPNYFGRQRFGRDGENLVRGARFFAGEIKASRSQRGYYLSAARAYLFNCCLARCLKDGSWSQAEAAGPLFGDPQDGVAAINSDEESILQQYPELACGIHKNRMKLERRAYCVRPCSFEAERDGDVLTLVFELPAGAFATTLLEELVAYTDESGRGAE
ncbi:MAG: tRNA pseudouridine(13) synthase TruD [Oleiphilaceae bacterium]|nr:tRNA pseudouridine(13) synthase TruD [Oleiphilaceae bacterium]